MPVVHKTVLLRYSAHQMFSLVSDVESYPLFLPWCSGADAVRRAPNQVDARLMIDYRGIRQSFSTRNEEHVPHRISMALLDGPFSRLQGHWHFLSLRSDACKIDFALDYVFAAGLLGHALAPVFGQIARSMVDAFVARAESVYGGTG